jgi:hypothetical protein
VSYRFLLHLLFVEFCIFWYRLQLFICIGELYVFLEAIWIVIYCVFFTSFALFSLCRSFQPSSEQPIIAGATTSSSRLSFCIL